MAQAFGNAYRETGWRALYSSSLRRSITTAQLLCHALGVDLRVRAELNEIAYGKWEGLTKERVNQEYHDDYVSWLADPAWHAPTGGELAHVIARRGLTGNRRNPTAVYAGNILIVSHKATIRIILVVC